MKRSAFKMAGYSYPEKSPVKHEDKIGEGKNLGNQAAADAHNKKHTTRVWDDNHKPIVKQK